jgi:hypothetical protein
LRLIGRLEKMMADEPDERRPADLTRIDISEGWQLAYWRKELQCTEAELRHAAKAIGPSANAVRAYLNRPRS